MAENNQEGRLTRLNRGLAPAADFVCDNPGKALIAGAVVTFPIWAGMSSCALNGCAESLNNLVDASTPTHVISGSMPSQSLPIVTQTTPDKHNAGTNVQIDSNNSVVNNYGNQSLRDRQNAGRSTSGRRSSGRSSGGNAPDQKLWNDYEKQFEDARENFADIMEDYGQFQSDALVRQTGNVADLGVAIVEGVMSNQQRVARNRSSTRSSRSSKNKEKHLRNVEDSVVTGIRAGADFVATNHQGALVGMTVDDLTQLMVDEQNRYNAVRADFNDDGVIDNGIPGETYTNLTLLANAEIPTGRRGGRSYSRGR